MDKKASASESPRGAKAKAIPVPNLHYSAVVSPRAKIGNRVVIGPFCVIEDDVTLGDGCRLASHVVVKNGTHMGENNVVEEGAVLGGRPQHLKAGQHVGTLIIGSGNTIREHVTIHCGLKEGETTFVGNNNLLMVNIHIGHDCRVSDHVVIANNTMLAGHTEIEHHAYLSGAVGTHQFCRIGQYAMVGGQAHIKQDVPPYVTVDGYSSLIVGLNLIGLRRNNFSNEDIAQLKAAYRVIFRRELSWDERLNTLSKQFSDGPAAAFFPFLTSGRRGFLQARQEPRHLRTVLAEDATLSSETLEFRKAA